jgi:quercetin dioxygenase-like cupin family protein
MRFDHGSTPLTTLDSGPLRGLRHRTVIDRAGGSEALALWQEEHASGFRVPPHRHDCEEIIVVIEGSVIATVEEKAFALGPSQSVLIPAWALHGFEVTSGHAIRLLAIFASNDPRIFRPDGVETVPPWAGGASDHLLR